LWVENAVLQQIVSLHPDHLTSDELVVWLEDQPTGTGRSEIMSAIGALKHCGLVRQNGKALEPTFAALRAAAILTP
jgi:hypothetical protein